MSRLHRIAAAALAGVLVTFGLLTSPLLAGLPPLVPPYVPIDLRWVLLPLGFAGLQALAERLVWPASATAVLGAGTMAAVGINLPSSQVLAFLGVGWARPGPAIDLVAMATSLATIAIGLGIAFDAAHERFRDELLGRGLPSADLETIQEEALDQARGAIAPAVLAVAGLALAIRVLGQALGGAALPLPEVAAIVLVLAAGALLVGLPSRSTA